MLRVRWSVEIAQKAREVALAAKSCALHARVEAHSTRSLRDIGGACVQLRFEHAPLMPGGWVVGVRSASHDEDAFLPALGGAPGDHRHGRLDAMIMAEPADGGVTFLPEERLHDYLPVGSAVEVAPIWPCNDFFDLRTLFAEVAADRTGAIDSASLRELMKRETGAAPTAEQVEAVVSAADAEGRRDFGAAPSVAHHPRRSFERPCRQVTFEGLRSTSFYRRRMCARIEQLAERAAERVESMHEGAPWEGVLVEAGSVRALVEGTGL